MMVSCRELQNAYLNMYKELRNYIWGFNIVENLAELEINVYSAFPDVSKLKVQFNNLYLGIKSVLSEDEELRKSVEAFQESLNNIDDDFFFKLSKVQEVKR